MVIVRNGLAEFKFFRPQARQVFLAGDFNGWQTTAMPMKRTSEGYWYALLRLPRGIYRFRYLADNVWFTDYAAFGIERGPLGTDSILRVDMDDDRTPNALSHYAPAEEEAEQRRTTLAVRASSTEQ